MLNFVSKYYKVKSKNTSTVPFAPVATIIKARWVITVASDGFGPCPEDIISYGAVAIEGNRIKAVGPAEKVLSRYEHVKDQTEEITLSDYHVLIPGLINCHTHLAMSFLRGYSDDQELMTWLTKYIWPTEKAVMNDDYVYQGTLIACFEAIKSGTTMLNDSYFLPDASMRAVEASGIRCVHAEPLLDFGDNSLPKQLERAKKLIIRLREDSLKSFGKEDSLLRPSFNPHAAYTVPQEWIQKGCDFIRELNKETPHIPIIFHTHLHETQAERDKFELEHEGKSALQVMDEAGAVNEYMVAAHCVKMLPEEIKLMAQKKANVCHCPKSNLKLASGLAPINDMLKAGVNVCLGTDGGCSNNSIDMFSEMQFAALINKVTSMDATALDAYTVLRMATRNGSRALGRLADLGSLEEGKLADIVAVDLAGVNHEGLPIFDPVSHLVYTTHVQVTDVWCNGKNIMKNKQIQTVSIKPEEQQALFEKLVQLRQKLNADAQEA